MALHRFFIAFKSDGLLDAGLPEVGVKIFEDWSALIERRTHKPVIKLEQVCSI